MMMGLISYSRKKGNILGMAEEFRFFCLFNSNNYVSRVTVLIQELE